MESIPQKPPPQRRAVTSVSLPEDLKRRMDAISTKVPVNWSEVARQAFLKVVEQVEQIK